MSSSSDGRTLGLLGATGVGVGAIVGGGILALAGVAFATTGPSAIVAFALNGLIAVVTALSFAEMSASFPESGGTYTFAKKVLTVEAAFIVGWVVWFASIVAAVLYALGFAAFAAAAVEQLWRAAAGTAPEWLTSRLALLALALGATAFYTRSLMRTSAGGGQWATIGKVVLFAVLIAAGAWTLAGTDFATVRPRLSPFFTSGGLGLFQAMGYTFIALQGFDLIAAVGGEVKRPGRNLPRAMLLSLAIALAIYLPLLFLVATVSVAPGESITELAADNPETVIAIAAGRFLGSTGFWLVMVAAVLSMLSALQANLYAASRVAMAMANDRTLPRRLGRLDPRRGTPVAAVVVTAATVAAVLVLVPDVAAAGAMSSLIFLVSFAIAHWTNILARRRGGAVEAPFRLPWFPLIPVVGSAACLTLAIFQGVAVPAAGVLATLWLSAGAALYFSLLAPRAQVYDASAEALDPQLVRLRGRSPLVLVPIANPASAHSLVTAASALVTPGVGRVVLLSILGPPESRLEPGEAPQQLVDAQAVLGEALMASFAGELAPETLITIAAHPWTEIARVSNLYRCESLLLGLGRIDEEILDTPIENLMSDIDCDVVVLRAPPGWQLSTVRRVLVPVGGRRDQSRLRARLLGSLHRTGEREVTYLGVFPEDAGDETCARARRDLRELAHDEAGGARVEVVRAADVVAELASHAAESDLVVLGLRRLRRRQKAFGETILRLAAATECPLILISSRG